MADSSRTRYTALIAEVALAYKLEPVLVEAVVLKESAGNTDAFRFEVNFYNRYLKVAPEWAWARQKYANPRRISSSYGLMQVMWVVALEEGYSKDVPPEGLFVPKVGLVYGCRRLQKLMLWAKGFPAVDPDNQLLAALASYNGGRGGNTPGSILRNGAYARDVLKIRDSLLTS